MKKKEKDDVMGEDVSSLPEAKSEVFAWAAFAYANHQSSTMREPGMRLTACVVLPTTDQECRRTSDVFLQVHKMQQAVEDILSENAYITCSNKCGGIAKDFTIKWAISDQNASSRGLR